MKLFDILFPFWRAVISVRLTTTGALWLVLLWHIFGWGILYAIIRSL